MHDAVVGQRVHPAGLALARLEHAQGLGDRHLVDQDLAVAQRPLGHAVAGLDDRRLGRARGRPHPGRAGEEGADRHGVGGVVRPLVDHLEHVVGPRQAAVTCIPPVPQP